MNFDVLRNSSPQVEVSHYVEWRSLNYAFRYDVITHPHNLRSCSHYVEWRSLNYVFRYDVIAHPHNLSSAMMLNGGLCAFRCNNSSPQLEVSHDVEWRSLNHAFRYDVITHPHNLRSAMMLNGGLWTMVNPCLLLWCIIHVLAHSKGEWDLWRKPRNYKRKEMHYIFPFVLSEIVWYPWLTWNQEKKLCHCFSNRQIIIVFWK